LVEEDINISAGGGDLGSPRRLLTGEGKLYLKHFL
jgi:hypothetical protein